MTALATHADRFAAGLQATWGLFAAFVLLLGLAYVAARWIDAAACWLSRPTDPRDLVARAREEKRP